MTSTVDYSTPADGVTGVILAGGQSSRMGSNKALLPYCGGRFIEAIHRQFCQLFDEVLLVTNNPEQYRFLNCPMVPDIHPGMGALAGLHTGLLHSRTSHIFAAACDMPYLNESLVKALVARRHQADVIIPRSTHGLEPLHAVYGKVCLPPMEQALLSGKRRIVSFFDQLHVLTFEYRQVAAMDPECDSFRNINTPEDYFELRKNENGAHVTMHPAHKKA